MNEYEKVCKNCSYFRDLPRHESKDPSGETNWCNKMTTYTTKNMRFCEYFRWNQAILYGDYAITG